MNAMPISQSSYRSPAAIKELRDMGVAALRDMDTDIHVAIKKEPHAGCGAD